MSRDGVPVSVRIHPSLRRLAGGRDVVAVVLVSTVGELVAALGLAHPGLGRRLRLLGRSTCVRVGQEDVHYLQGLDTPLAGGAEVSISVVPYEDYASECPGLLSAVCDWLAGLFDVGAPPPVTRTW